MKHLGIALEEGPDKVFKEALPNALLKSESKGIPFEITTPAPPFVPAGETALRSVVETMLIFHAIGVQTNQSMGLHAHVNLVSDEAPRPVKATMQQVARVFAGVAKYQFVLDEFLSDDRPGGSYNLPLLLKDGAEDSVWSRMVFKVG